MAANELPDQGDSLRVLVVEDETLVAILLEDMLTELGHQTIGPIARLSKGLEAAQREDMDIAILDVNLNGDNTFPIAGALDARGIPFIFATGYGRANLPKPFSKAPVLQKPFQQSDLRDILAQARKAADA